MAGTALVTQQLKSSAAGVSGTNYWPSSSGQDLSIVKNQRSIAFWITDAGHASATVDYTVEYSRDGTNWFTGPPTYGLDVMAQVTTSAVKYLRKMSVPGANYVRIKQVCSATAGAADIQMTFDGVDGYSA